MAVKDQEESDREVSDLEESDREESDREVSDREGSDREGSDREVSGPVPSAQAVVDWESYLEVLGLVRQIVYGWLTS